MRNITFAMKDLAAIHAMPLGDKEQIRQLAGDKIKQLGIKPTRVAHGTKFDANQLFHITRDDKGRVVSKTPIEHTISVREILRYIDNVEVIADNDESTAAQNTLCRIYLLVQ